MMAFDLEKFREELRLEEEKRRNRLPGWGSLYRVGPDDYNRAHGSYGIHNPFLWVIYWYEEESYGGHGEAVGLDDNDNLHILSLREDSIGVFEDGGWEGADKVHLYEFLGSLDDVHGYIGYQAIVDKVLELLRQ